MSIDIKSVKTKEELHTYYDKVLEQEHKTRERRENVNNFFLSASSLVFSAAAFMSNKAATSGVFIVSVNMMGALFAVLWLQSLSRYKLELSRTYKAIQKLEAELKINIFTESLGPTHGKKLIKRLNLMVISRRARWLFPLYFSWGT